MPTSVEQIWTLFKLLLFRSKSKQSYCSDVVIVVLHELWHSDHILEAGAKDFTASVCVALLLVDGAVHLEAYVVELGVVGSRDRDHQIASALGVDLGVNLAKLSTVARARAWAVIRAAYL